MSNPIENPEIDPDYPELRRRIIDTIIYSQNFWLVYKENTLGMAGFLDLRYKKSYIEILFFTRRQSEERNGRTFEIRSPLLRELNFRPIFGESYTDNKGLVEPRKVYNKIIELVDTQIKMYLYILDNEVRKIKEEFESYPVGGNPYVRDIYIYIGGRTYKVTVDFEKFPQRPDLTFDQSLEEIIPKSEFMEVDFMKYWSEDNPVSVTYIIEHLAEMIARKTGAETWTPESQQIIYENVRISENLPPISLGVLHGETVGIVYGEYGDKNVLPKVRELFGILSCSRRPLEGKITFYGRTPGFGPKSNFPRTFIVEPNIPADLAGLPVGRALTRGIRPSFPRNIKGGPVGRMLYTARLKKDVLDAVGLINHKKTKVGNLSTLRKLMFMIARTLMMSPHMVLFIVPFGSIGRLEIEQFLRNMDKIKSRFHTVLVIYGPHEIVSECDRVITITEDKVDAGSVDELMMKIPQSGEIIVLELNNPKSSIGLRALLKKAAADAVLIEERENERYKIFSREDPDRLIVNLVKAVGPYIYHFKRIKPTLTEYLEFMEMQGSV